MEPFEILVMISNPDDFLGWPQAQKIERYERVVQWHEYISRLHEEGKAPCVWGSHQLLSRASLVSSLGLRLAVYRVESWPEFDELILADPLRDVSRYVTVPLAPLLGDREEDNQRFAESTKRLLSGNDPTRALVHSLYKSLFAQEPDYVGGSDSYPQQPSNPATEIGAEEKRGDPLQIMLMGVNPEEAAAQWDDTRTNFHYEKVNWWHDYIAMLVGEGKVSHAWAANIFFDITGVSGYTKGAGVAIYQVESFDEFGDLFRADSIREMTVFWSVLLQPVANQRRLDDEQLQRARASLNR